ncbi:ABC transporter permease [Enterococcus cecorum]|uniref:ABC transporter permease n=1 Tax=Enterococcus cecorum TaxID=44008 RepID=A0AAW9JUH7_9ENTE|nr:ABC transporter permease [Enterococcus cecorum]MCJ0571645.1 ABC transporter permease [Enterococcus cecorum]MCJ0578275.1 ABC transporter permease [Enterococcus cecorum]MCJ0582264.1 ABC transporter permease [Enterococcus cecorum]MCJ0584437.1 ABC transporter permease [Enterococcus cecorum]MCJ0589828.1 ABC transporter permease [Enterococcus cecorum]
MSKFWIIALNVYKKQVRSAAFLIMVLAPLVIGALYYGMGKFMSDASSIDKIGVYDQQMVLANALSQSKEFEFIAMKSEKFGEKQLAEDKIDAFLVLDTSKEVIEAKLLAKDSVETSTQLKLRMMLSQIQRQVSAQKLGLSAQQLAQLDQQVPLTVNKVTVNDQGRLTKKQEDGAAVQMIIGFACTIILFLFIANYANIIAQEIATEKGSRIMEIILSSTKASTHYYGKIMGVILVGLTQMAVYIPVFLLGLYQFKDNEQLAPFLASVDFGARFSWPLFLNIVLVALFVLTGIVQYAVLSAVAGSLVNRAEETSKAIMPVMYLAMIGYFGGLVFSFTNTQSPILTITSYIPYWSSFAMPLRIVNEVVSYPGAFISLALNIVISTVVMVLSAKMYKANVLVYNDRGVLAAFKQSIKLMKTVK